MAVTGRAEMIRAIFAAYLANDRERVEDALSDDFRFTSPFDDSIDKPTYFERCWKNSRLDRTARTGEDLRRGR